MNSMDAEKATFLIGRSLGDLVSSASDAPMARARLSAAIGVALVSIPDTLWERMVEEAGTPCGRPLCDCHVGTEQLFQSLIVIRETSIDTKDLAEKGIEP